MGTAIFAGDCIRYLMKKRSPFLFASLTAFTIFFISCKKSNSSAAQCRITEVEVSNTTDSENIKLEYSNDKKLLSLLYTPSNIKRTLAYQGNFIIETVINANGSANEIDTIALNADRLVSNEIWHIKSGSSELIEYDTMTYNASKQLIKIIQSTAGVKEVYNSTWDNGDISNSAGDTYTYFTDKSAADGDFFWVGEVLREGIRLTNCKHLCKSSGAYTISYLFDKDDKITSMTIIDLSSPRKFQYNYTYACN